MTQRLEMYETSNLYYYSGRTSEFAPSPAAETARGAHVSWRHPLLSSLLNMHVGGGKNKKVTKLYGSAFGSAGAVVLQRNLEYFDSLITIV